MSSGGSIPYHLRQNKAIERNLFVDLLNRFGRYRNISSYTYVGFGGPFLEDFRLLHSSLRIEKMISIEVDEDVFYRQVFNQPVSCVSLRLQSSGDFIFDYDFDTSTVIWLDYARPVELHDQLAETQRLVEKLNHGDIFKITVNADPEPLGRPSNVALLDYRLSVATERLGAYAPAEMSRDDVTRANFPYLLQRAILSAARQGVRGASSLYIQPLTSFVYADGQQMLTVTCAILETSKKAEFLASTRLAAWPFCNLDAHRPVSISVPAFSVKERLHVESLLPQKDATEIIANMGYSIDEKPAAALALMEHFVAFYRLYPWYSRVVL